MRIGLGYLLGFRIRPTQGTVCWEHRDVACYEKNRGKVTFGIILVMKTGIGSSEESISNEMAIDKVTRNSLTRF